MNQRIDRDKEDEGHAEFNGPCGQRYVFDPVSGIYKPKEYTPGADCDNRKNSDRKVSFWSPKVRRKWFILVVPNIISLGTLLIVSAYTYYAARQTAASENANYNGMKANRDSGRGLSLTLSRMQDQTTEMHTLSKNSAEQSARTKELAQTSKDALVSVQRAFVFFTDLEGSRVLDPSDHTKISQLNFFIGFVNNGTTPTRHMSVHFSWLPSQTPLPDNFPYPDLGSLKPTPIALGPKMTGSTTTVTIAAPLVDDIKAGKTIFYVWGWARYGDVFENSKPHITRFCTEITGFVGEPLNPNDGTAKPITVNCPANNCYDDECQVQ